MGYSLLSKRPSHYVGYKTESGNIAKVEECCCTVVIGQIYDEIPKILRQQDH